MKVIYEFDTVEDRDDLKVYQQARAHKEAVYQVTLEIRNYFKHHEPADTAPDSDHKKALTELLTRINSAVEGLGYWDMGAYD